jgi:hypothetical protein
MHFESRRKMDFWIRCLNFIFLANDSSLRSSNLFVDFFLFYRLLWFGNSPRLGIIKMERNTCIFFAGTFIPDGIRYF